MRLSACLRDTSDFTAFGIRMKKKKQCTSLRNQTQYFPVIAVAWFGEVEKDFRIIIFWLSILASYRVQTLKRCDERLPKIIRLREV
jgi:hypothetical protein